MNWSGLESRQKWGEVFFRGGFGGALHRNRLCVPVAVLISGFIGGGDKLQPLLIPVINNCGDH